MAPELIHPVNFGPRHSQLSKGSDIYVMGTVVYEVLMGVHPFDVETEETTNRARGLGQGATRHASNPKSGSCRARARGLGAG